MRMTEGNWKVGNTFNQKQNKMLTLLYFCKDGVFRGGPAKGIDTLVSRNFSDRRPPITVPYLHQGITSQNFKLCSYTEEEEEKGRRQGWGGGEQTL
jgi:hypothetical protein